jgi:hypothetical protein
VQKRIYEQFAKALVSFLLAFLSHGGSLMVTSSFHVLDKENYGVKAGPGTEDGVFVGPLTHERAV